MPAGSTPPKLDQLANVAHYVHLIGQLVAQRSIAQRRSQRLHSMLEMTTRWNQSRETEALLDEMAHTSTKLLDAQRATIFLWDKANRQLIGKPALGVAAGEIRVPENAGVVGQVIATGQPQRVDADVAPEQAQINRSVDQQLGFQTRSLLCVPMFDTDGRIVGAFELINKTTGSFTDDDLEALAELAASASVAISNTRHVQHLVSSRKQIADQAAQRVQLIGDSARMNELRNTVQRVAKTDLAVLILGENGTGKEVVAQLIHYLSPRRDQVLVTVNCAAITETLLESELFGHEKGAFTDAHEARQGKFELANGGTLFLDEIGDMSLGGQAKLLRVLEEKIVVRVGGSKPISTDVRVLAATNQDLAQLVRDKKFREDLFFRLNVVSLKIPALRERGDDVLRLAQHFLKEFCARSRRDIPRLSPNAEKALLKHAWPGNVRELRNMMERIAYLLEGNTVEAADLAFIMSPKPGDSDLLDLDTSLADATGEFQRQFIQRRIKQTRGNMTDAAERLGLHRSNLYRKMRQLGMHVDEEEA
jgi:Nif-specific regulatory protein